MDMRARLLKGAIWITAARAISNLLGLVTTLALARLLIPTDFGLVALGTTLLAVVSAITDIPLTEALVQHQKPSRDHFHTAFTLTMVRGVIVALLFAALSWPVADLYNDRRIIDVMLVLAAGMVLNGLGNPRAIMMTKELIFWQQFMLQVAQRLTSLVVSVGIAIVWHSYWALLIGSIAGQLVTVLVSYTILPFKPELTFRHARELMSFSIWLTFGQIVNTLNWRLDQLLIGKFLGTSPLGFYVVADNLAIMPTREATLPLTTTVFPAFSKLANDPPRLTAAYNKAQTLTSAVALPLGVGLAVIAEPLVRLTMGERWLPAIFIIQALASVFAIQTIGSLAQPLAMATGKTFLLFNRDWQAFLFRVPFILLGMYLDGLPGIVYARVLAGTVSIVFNTSIVTRITGLTLLQQIRPNLRALLSTALMALVVAAFATRFAPSFDALRNFQELALLIPLGALVYVACMLTLWRLAGCPAGPEQEVLSVLGKIKGLGKRAGMLREEA